MNLEVDVDNGVNTGAGKNIKGKKDRKVLTKKYMEGIRGRRAFNKIT